MSEYSFVVKLFCRYNSCFKQGVNQCSKVYTSEEYSENIYNVIRAGEAGESPHISRVGDVFKLYDDTELMKQHCLSYEGAEFVTDSAGFSAILP